MNIAIVLSGGVGSRMGLDIPKQYLLVNDQPIINYCLKTFLDNNNTDVIVIGVAEEWKKYVIENLGKLNPNKVVYFSPPGLTRQYSIYNALKVLKDRGFKNDDVVLIHDAARPLVNHDLINRCYDECRVADGVMPVVPVKDTVYYSEDGNHIKSLLKRSCLWAGQSPEAFLFGKYFHIHEQMKREELLKINGSTEIAFMAGLECHMVEGDPMNFKITTREDLSNFKAILNTRKK